MYKGSFSFINLEKVFISLTTLCIAPYDIKKISINYFMLKIFPVKTYLVVKENCFIYQTIGFVLLNHDPM